MYKKLLLVLLLSISMPVFADVFGLKGGMSFSQISKKVQLVKSPFNEDLYIASGTPSGDQIYNMYIFEITKKCGLSSIQLSKQRIPFGRNGGEFADKVLEILKPISQEYGAAKIEYSKNKDIKDEEVTPQDIDIEAVWGGKDEPKLPNDIGLILAKAKPEGQTGDVTLSYLFRSAAACLGR